MKMRLNASLVRLVLLSLAATLKYSNAETSAASAAIDTSTDNTTLETYTHGVRGASALFQVWNKAPIGSEGETFTDFYSFIHSDTMTKEWHDCTTKRKCNHESVWVNIPLAWRLEICYCGCAGHQHGGGAPSLWIKCVGARECFTKYEHCMYSCRKERQVWPGRECLESCGKLRMECSCGCLQLTHAQASAAISAATTCSPAEKTVEEWSICVEKFENERAENEPAAVSSQCRDKGERCEEEEMLNFICGCMTSSSTHYELSDEVQKCESGCRSNEDTCNKAFIKKDTERKNWCHVNNVKCVCACLQGAGATSNGTAQHRVDRAALELCAYARSCGSKTCDCDEKDGECLSDCRDSCRCGCFDFGAAGPGVRPADERMWANECRNQEDACRATCDKGNTSCIDRCFVEREMCSCKCAGRSRGPQSTGTSRPTDSGGSTGENKINMYCNYLT